MKSLKYIETKQINGRVIRKIEITLDDKCKNGFCEFHISTSTEKLVFGHWRDCYGGEKQRMAERATFRDYFAMFSHVDGCTSWGAPWYAVANGRYFLEREGVKKCAEFLNISEDVAEKLDSTDDKLFKYQLHVLGIVDEWKRVADIAIENLERICGSKFEDYDNPRCNLTLTEEEKKDVEEKIASGFYSPQAVAQRKADKERAEREEKRKKLVYYYDNKIAEYQLEKAVMLAIFDLFGTEKNVIFYNHRNTICFNYTDPQFSTYEKHWTKKEVEQFQRECDSLIGTYSINVEIK